jgi:hypothetical protein
VIVGGQTDRQTNRVLVQLRKRTDRREVAAGEWIAIGTLLRTNQ